jgi:hypothetical protein
LTELPPDSGALRDEERRLRRLKAVVDLTTAVLAQGRLDRVEAEEIVDAARSRILEMFPDKRAAYDLILAPRFARLLEGCPHPPARVLPFRRTAAD